MARSDRVTLVEVGPRDGLQNESAIVPTATKIELIQRLAACGVADMEVASFVRPDLVPQMADGVEVAAAVIGLPGLRSIALTPNVRGLAAAAEAGISEVAVFGAASETFSQRNLNCSIDVSLERFGAVAAEATQRDMRVRGYVSTVMGCPYEGEIAESEVVRLVEAFFAMGCHEVSVADTIGVGTPGRTTALFQALEHHVPLEHLSFHGHDTYGMGVANALAALDVGVRSIDASIGGLGGCPFAGPRARGNVATEDVVYAVGGSPEFDLDLDLDRLVETSVWICDELGRPPASSVTNALR
ncbi:MAG: hydroxymethylglutaryl-CoA lyase [Ilumatobacteraceae bacterium]|nr:hydroxymethylglutaryl-CoA lyase [Ilumatobacteraceae bacterium]